MIMELNSNIYRRIYSIYREASKIGILSQDLPSYSLFFKKTLHYLACIDHGIFKTFNKLTAYDQNYLINLFENNFLAGYISRKKYHAETGAFVPPVLALTILTNCNLSCKGCFAYGYGKNSHLAEKDIHCILSFFQSNGTRYFVILGGEPLLYNAIISILSLYKKSIFLLYTNATMINASHISELQSAKNVIPVLSIDGGEHTTNNRRGNGVYGQVLEACNNLVKAKIPYGISTTVFKSNFDEVCNEPFASRFESTYLVLHTFMQYMAVGCNSDAGETLSEEMKVKFAEIVRARRRVKDYLIGNIPQDELDLWGSCPSAGKGLLHINASGDVEPCMFTHYSSTNIYQKQLNFDTVLKSEYLRVISTARCRGCLAFEKREDLLCMNSEVNAINTELNYQVQR